MRFVALVFIAFLFAGCGYKPLSKITNDIMGDEVYVHVIIDKSDPKSSVWITDAIKEGIVSRLNRKLSDDKNAKTKITAYIKSLNLQALV